MSRDNLIAELDAIIAANANKPKAGKWQEWEIEILRKYGHLPGTLLAVKLDRPLAGLENKRRRDAVEVARRENKT